MNHGTGFVKYGSPDVKCNITGCDCEGFRIYSGEHVPAQRAVTIKTLDQTDPRLFDV